MNGPTTAAYDAEDTTHAASGAVSVLPSRQSTVGRLPVRRALPRRGLRTVGPWCFADHFGPEPVTETEGLDIGPHPHIGLHTVTWLVDGAVLHKDSLGSEQLIRPGQLNLMTAGHGVVHAEEAADSYRGTLHGVQLWVAQPGPDRDGEPGFEHHATLPQVTVGSGDVTVLLGGFADIESPARHDSPVVGAEAVLRPGRSVWPLRRDFEYALVVLEGAVAVGPHVVEPGSLAFLGQGATRSRSRLAGRHACCCSAARRSTSRSSCSGTSSPAPATRSTRPTGPGATATIASGTSRRGCRASRRPGRTGARGPDAPPGRRLVPRRSGAGRERLGRVRTRPPALGQARRRGPAAARRRRRRQRARPAAAPSGLEPPR